MSLSAAHSPEERGHTLDQMLDSIFPHGFLFIYAGCDWFLSAGNRKIQNLGVLYCASAERSNTNPPPQKFRRGGGLVCETLSVKEIKITDINCDHQQILSWEKKSLARAETMFRTTDFKLHINLD